MRRREKEIYIKIPDEIKKAIKFIISKFKKKFNYNFKSLMLYGSWAKGEETEFSDIDLLAIFDKVDKDIIQGVHNIINKIKIDSHIEIVCATIKDFKKEKLPLYTAIKKEAIVIYGEVDRRINPIEPHIKYAEFFNRSAELERSKVKIAERILKEYPHYGSAELCFFASKHAIQAALAMKGEGYSSKIKILLATAEKYFNKKIIDAFKNLLKLYVKSEYKAEHLTLREAKRAIKYAKTIMRLYDESEKY